MPPSVRTVLLTSTGRVCCPTPPVFRTLSHSVSSQLIPWLTGETCHGTNPSRPSAFHPAVWWAAREVTEDLWREKEGHIFMKTSRSIFSQMYIELKHYGHSPVNYKFPSMLHFRGLFYTELTEFGREAEVLMVVCVALFLGHYFGSASGQRHTHRGSLILTDI